MVFAVSQQKQFLVNTIDNETHSKPKTVNTKHTCYVTGVLRLSLYLFSMYTTGRKRTVRNMHGVHIYIHVTRPNPEPCPVPV